MIDRSILDYILTFQKVTIQCHNIPDADTIASGWAMYLFLQSKGKDVQMIYGGPQPVRKRNLLQMIRLFEIPIRYIPDPEAVSFGEDELLLVVDAQYGSSNVAPFTAQNRAIIDHHPTAGGRNPHFLILPEYQSCSTVVWELLTAEGFPVLDNRYLKIALSYGLYTDTSEYSDLSHDIDIEMMKAVGTDYPELDMLKKANLTMSELLIAADAIYHNFSDLSNHFMIISALKCDQTILGVIGDLAIRVDIIDLVISFTGTGTGYRFSIRSTGNLYRANSIAQWLAEGLGGGGGHERKAAGLLSSSLLKQKYPGMEVEDVIALRVKEWIRQQDPALLAERIQDL